MAQLRSAPPVPGPPPASATPSPRLLRRSPALVRQAAVHVWRGRVASDPGLLRLRLAVRAVLSVGLSSAVLHVVGPAVGLPAVVAMLLGGMIGMNGSFAASSRAPLDAVLTLGGLPLAAAAGAVPAALAAGHTVLELAGFVLVMVAAVFVRRLGPRWFNYGMVAWLCYFFATFIGVRVSGLPGLLAVICCATACLMLVAGVVVPDRPVAMRAAARQAFVARVHALAGTARQVLSGGIGPEQAEARLHGRSFRLVEAALILDGALAGTDDATAAQVRRTLVEVELGAEQLAGAVLALRAAPVPAPVRAGLLDALQALEDARLEDARTAAQGVRDVLGAAAELPAAVSRPVRALVFAADDLARVMQRPAAGATPFDEQLGAYEPAVELYLGNLPGSAPSAKEAASGHALGWSLNTRLCVQTAVAAPLALVLGHALSAQRYYWAVLACFLVLTGTFTTGEAAAKGLNRVLGTVAGLAAATLAVHLTGDHDLTIVAVMLVNVFLGLYFFRVSYALMAFAVTTVMGLLYDVLHEFSDRLLLLRLVETVLGAGVAVLVVLVVLPVHTADARSAARTAFLEQLAGLLADVRDRLRSPVRAGDLLYDTRVLDAALHQLALVSLPSSGPTLTGVGRRRAVGVLARYTAVAARARSLAAGVVGVEPGSLPGLAERCEDLRRRSLGEPAQDGVGPRPPGEVSRLVDELDDALTALEVPERSPAGA